MRFINCLKNLRFFSGINNDFAAASRFRLPVLIPGAFLRHLQLFAYARKVAEEEQVSMNQFFVTAIAEKISALKTEAYFQERQGRGDPIAFDAWLAASLDDKPMAGDECNRPAQPPI